MRARSRSPARRGAIRGDAGARCKGGQAARKLHAGAIFKRPSTAEVVADILQGEASQELRAERKAPPPAAPPPAAPPVAADPALDEKLLALAFAADATPSPRAAPRPLKAFHRPGPAWRDALDGAAARRDRSGRTKAIYECGAPQRRPGKRPGTAPTPSLPDVRPSPGEPLPQKNRRAREAPPARPATGPAPPPGARRPRRPARPGRVAVAAAKPGDTASSAVSDLTTASAPEPRRAALASTVRTSESAPALVASPGAPDLAAFVRLNGGDAARLRGGAALALVDDGEGAAPRLRLAGDDGNGDALERAEDEEDDDHDEEDEDGGRGDDDGASTLRTYASACLADAVESAVDADDARDAAHAPRPTPGGGGEGLMLPVEDADVVVSRGEPETPARPPARPPAVPADVGDDDRRLLAAYRALGGRRLGVSALEALGWKKLRAELEAQGLPGRGQGRKRERNSQLQRLRSRPVSTRFG